MAVAAFWSEGWTAAVVNHLWQSTVVVGIAWVLAWALRKNHARARYWVWMAASVKFLLPFSVLMTAGEWLRSLMVTPVVVRPAVVNVMEQVAQPFAQAQILGTASPVVAQHANWLPVVLLSVWACGALVVAIRFGRGWWRVWCAKRAALKTSNRRSFDSVAAATFAQDDKSGFAVDVPVMCTAELMEPGIFGIFRPVLLMPEGILELLTAEQLRAIVAHEMCHVRRRDNLTFAVHMLVEVLFWFHPAVWWIGSRLIEERERACDEGVVEAGGEAEVYAEGILNVRTFYVESPVACVAGVTGADLKKRIVRIMTEQGARKLSSSRRLLLAMAGALALTVPLMLGLVRAQNGSANSAGLAEAPHGTMKLPKFDVVSIKPYGPSQMMIRIDTKPDGISVSGMPMHMIVREAFGVTNDRLLGEPDWVNAERYDIDAKVAPEDVPKLKGLTPQQRWEMLLPVLVERCGLKFHHETRNLTVYTLVVAKGGPKLTPSTLAGDSTKVAPERHQSSMGLSVGDKGMTLSAHGASMESIARWISLQIGSTVVDKTGLTGTYDYRLEFAPDESMRGVVLPHGAGGDSPPPEADGPSIFTALQEQLGLKLVAEKQSVDVVVIDGMERPTAN